MSQLFERIPNITLITACPNSGKTFLCRYLLHNLFQNQKLNYGLVFCATAFNESFSFLPKKYIYSQFDENKIKQLMNIQITQMHQSGEAKPAFIIFDDMIGSVNFTTPLFSKLITTYRQYNILLIFTTQYLFKVPPVLRECTYFVTFKHRQKEVFKRFTKHL
jgi:GTPase SAR1 family protein